LSCRCTRVCAGRPYSASRNIHPEIDCETDRGEPPKGQTTTDGTRWWVERPSKGQRHLRRFRGWSCPRGSVGVKRELNPDDRVYVGAWTRLVIRQATDEEKATLVA
jgi:hypothetical protein